MLRILTYHRVAEPSEAPTLDPRLISATPTAFLWQMRYLAQRYAVVSLEEVLHVVSTTTRLPKRAVLITFDDAYRDFGDIAWPIMQCYRLPATLCVPTGYPGDPEGIFWWDRLYQAVMVTAHTTLPASPLGTLLLATTEQRHASFRSLKNYLKMLPHVAVQGLIDDICDELSGPQVVQRSILNWDELRRLACEGVSLAAHSQTHPILPHLSPEAMREEISGSQQDLQREIGRALPVFCYPSGAYDDRTVKAVQEAGFELAFATDKGTTLPRSQAQGARDLLRLRRTNVSQRTSPAIFRFRLARWGPYVDTWRYRMRDWRPQRRHLGDATQRLHITEPPTPRTGQQR